MYFHKFVFKLFIYFICSPNTFWFFLFKICLLIFEHPVCRYNKTKSGTAWLKDNSKLILVRSFFAMESFRTLLSKIVVHVSNAKNYFQTVRNVWPLSPCYSLAMATGPICTALFTILVAMSTISMAYPPYCL